MISNNDENPGSDQLADGRVEGMVQEETKNQEPPDKELVKTDNVNSSSIPVQHPDTGKNFIKHHYYNFVPPI